MRGMRMLAVALAVVGLSMFLFANDVQAQCGANGTSQCGAPVSSQSSAQQLAQLQLNNGLSFNNGGAAAASSASTAAPVAAAPAAQTLAGFVNPAQVYLIMPTAQAIPTPPAVPEQNQTTLAVPATVGLYQFAAFPGGAAAAGGSSSASASASAGGGVNAALVPTPVPVPVNTAASVGCSSCGGRAGLFRGGLLRKNRSVSRSSSRSVSRS